MSIHSNGLPQEMQERAREKEEVEAGQQGLQAAFQEQIKDGTVKGEYLNQLVRSELDADRKRVLANLMSRDFVLGNYSPEQVNELKWQLQVMRESFLAMHPTQETAISGVFRAWLHGDKSQGLEPLTQTEIHQVNQFFEGVWSRITRGEEMKQQELMSTSISQSYVQRGDTSDGGGIFGRFRS